MKSIFKGRIMQLEDPSPLDRREVLVQLILKKSESATSSTTLSSGGIGRNRSNILNSTNTESITGKSSDGRLSSWARGLGRGSTSASQFDVNSVDADILKSFAYINSGKHSSIRRAFLSIGLDFHTTSDSAVCLTAG